MANLQVVIAAKDMTGGVLKSITGDLEGLGQKVAHVGGLSLGGLIGSLGALGLASFGVNALGSAIGGFMSDAIDAEKVQSQLNAVLESTHGISGMTSESVNALADSWSRMSPFEDEAVKGAENMLLTFTNIGKDVFPGALEATLNLSQALGQDLQSSSIQLGKALNDPIAGVTALQRVGVKLSETQKEQVAGFMKVNDIASAQKVILRELTTEFGGAAAAAGQTFAGKMSILSTQIGNVKEAIGNALLPILSNLVTAVTPVITAFAENLPAAIATVSDYVNNTFGPYIQAGVQLAGEAFAWLSVAVSTAMSDVLSVISSIGQAIYDALSWLNPFAEHSPSLVSQVADGLAAIMGSYDSITDIAIPLGTAGDAVMNFAGISKDALKDMVANSKLSLDDMKQALSGATQGLRDFMSAPIEGMGALDDQKFAMQQQKNQIQLQIEQLKLGGAVSRDIMTDSSKGHPATVAQAASPELIALEKQLSDLGQQASILDLQGKLKFDPLQRQIKKMTTTTKELTFEQITKGITFSQNAIALLTPAIARSEAAFKLQQAAATAASAAIGGKGGGKGGGGGGLAGALDALPGTFHGVNQVVADFKDKVAEAHQKVLDITGAVKDFLEPIGKAASGIAAFVSQLLQFDQGIIAVVTDLAHGGSITKALDDLNDYFVEAFDISPGEIIAKLATLGATVGNWIVGEAVALSALLASWSQAFVDWIRPTLPLITAELLTLESAFLDWIETASGPILAQLGLWANALIAWIVPATHEFLAQWPGMLNRFLDWIEVNAGPILVSLGEWAVAFVKWIVPMIPGFLEALGNIAIAITIFLAETFIVIEQRLLKWGLAFVNWVVPQIPGMLAELGKLAAALFQWVLDQGALIAPKMFDLGAGMIREMIRGLGSVLLPSVLTGIPGGGLPAAAAPAPGAGNNLGANNTGQTINVTVNGSTDPQAVRGNATQGVMAASRALGYT